MASGNDIDLDVISMKKRKKEKKQVDKRKPKIIMGDFKVCLKSKNIGYLHF